MKKLPSQYPSLVEWNIAFDGKTLGSLTGRTQKEFESYAEPGRQDIVKGTPPIMGKKLGDFSGIWDAAVYRPLVVVSEPNFKDPESWKPSPVPSSILKALRDEFRKRNPNVCRMENQDDDSQHPWQYASAKIQIKRAYTSSRGWSVVGLHLDDVRDCADEEAGDQIEDPWFIVDPAKMITFLDQGIMLVDAGDYDDDGKSEVLFVINRFPQGGYELFYDDFRKRAVFDLSAH